MNPCETQVMLKKTKKGQVSGKQGQYRTRPNICGQVWHVAGDILKRELSLLTQALKGVNLFDIAIDQTKLLDQFELLKRLSIINDSLVSCLNLFLLHIFHIFTIYNT